MNREPRFHPGGNTSYTIRLVGGPSDGRVFHSEALPENWRVPMPQPPIGQALLAPPDVEDPWQAMPEPNLRYWRTGSVNDIGEHLYRFEGTA